MARKTLELSLFDAAIARRAAADSFRKLAPRTLARNPVMFVVGVGAAITTLIFLRDLAGAGDAAFSGQLAGWLWFTVLFANFAEAVAEGRGRARADTFRAARRDAPAKRFVDEALSKTQPAQSGELKAGDVVLVEAGDLVPADGEVIEGVASVNESAITGESAPVIREAGGDRSAVTGGTTVVSDWVKVRVTQRAGESFLDRMIAMVESASRQKTPNEIALTILLVGMTIIFLIVVATLEGFAAYSGALVSVTALVALLVTLIPTTIGGLLSAIGIAGMDRLMKANVVAKSGRAIEAAGDVDTLLLDKTGTITFGNRMASEFVALRGESERELAEAAYLASLSDETPEGKSIVELARRRFSFDPAKLPRILTSIPFSAHTRMSGADLNHGQVRKGAVDAVQAHLGALEPGVVSELNQAAQRISMTGGTPLAVARDGRLLGVVHLKDVIKPDIRERFAELRRMGIRTVMVTGDNPLTAATIAAEAGVDDFLSEASPEKKLDLIRQEQAEGKLVAMCGDGSNDAPALAQSDVGLAMNNGTPAAREAANLIDLDSDPTKLLEVVHVGKQLLISRGSLTTFSIANDVAKYFAILPALFVGVYPQMQALNVMQLASPESAILSAIIFNALIIVALIPLALKGVAYRVGSAAELLRRNLLIYGVGGIVAPFAGIKAIDLVVSALGLA